jgi:hypothetical protein
MAEAMVRNVTGTVKWELRYYDNGGSLKAVSELEKPVLDTWYCVEVEGKSNTATSAESRIYVNGNELTDITQTGKNNTQQIDCSYIWISGSATVWYDDVVVDTAYIGPEPVIDVTPPVFGSITANTTSVGALCSFDCLISDDVNVSTYTFSTNNTGAWENDTALVFSSFYTSTAAWANVTKTLNDTGGNVVGYLWYANDTSNNWSASEQHNLTLTVLAAKLFEDGFESGDFSKWSVLAGGSVTSGEAHHGTYKAVFSSGYVQAQFAPVDHCFMRAYVMFKTFPANGTDCTVFGIWKSTSPNRYMAEVRVTNVSGIVKWRMRYYDNGTYYYVNSEQQNPVLDTWYCVEVEAKSNTLTGAESRIYVNGNELTDITQTGKSNDYPINQCYIWVNNGLTIWYDCVVVNSAYIGPEDDIAVSAVSASKTVVAQGYSTVVNAIVTNQGYFTETFNVTAYACHTYVIGTFINITLASGASTTLIFTWNTAGVPYGKYSISAYAQPVPAEPNIANNNFTDGNVVVTIPGDISGDFQVTLTDLVLLANAYGSRPGDVKWNPNADINGNGVVDLADLVTMAMHYGQHHP